MTDRTQLDEARRLLDAAMGHVTTHGLQDTSLRAMAEILGTSHRMLSYYFGSSDGFWQAMLVRLRTLQQEWLIQLSRQQQLPGLMQIWARLSAPDQLPLYRLMFEVYGKALGNPQRYGAYLDQVVASWLPAIAETLMRQHGWPAAQARLQARLRLAVIRGLLLDLLTTGDREGADAALAHFATLVGEAP